MFTIIKKPVPNHGTRGGRKPIAIVDHITIGERGSVINTFSNPGGNSSHYLVCRDGDILQFVDVTQRAHTNGYVRDPKSALVRSMGNLNANYYTVTIEHEGYGENGGDGTLTDDQFYASCWLHKYIQTEVQRIYGNKIALNSHQVIAHNQVDSLKGTCPGKNFPWTRLYAELVIADSMTLAAYEEHLAYARSKTGASNAAYALFNRFDALEARMREPGNAIEARRKIMLVAPVMAPYGAAENTAEAILATVKELRNNAIVNGQWVKAELDKLAPLIQQAKNVGLIP